MASCRVMNPVDMRRRHMLGKGIDREKPDRACLFSRCRGPAYSRDFKKMGFLSKTVDGNVFGYFAYKLRFVSRLFFHLAHSRSFGSLARLNAASWKGPDRHIAAQDEAHLFAVGAKKDANRRFHPIIIGLLLLLVSCDKYYLSVRQIPVDQKYLASTHVGSPDPRLAHPPLGQKLVVGWSVPSEILQKEPKVVLRLLFWDHSEKEIAYPIAYRTGYEVYSLLNEEFEKSKGLLTYRADIVMTDGQIYRTWKHQLWVNLIRLDEDASLTNSSVIDQSMHGSVTETPNSSDDGSSDKN